jgi:hypothetical protein
MPAEIDISHEPAVWRRWEKLSESSVWPEPRSAHGLAAMRDNADKLYVYGGFLGKVGEQRLSSELWEVTLPAVSTEQPVWTDMSNLADAPLLARSGHALIARGATLYVVGGDFGASAPDGMVYTLDTRASGSLKWEAHTYTPGGAKTYQAIGAVGDLVYFFGGSSKGVVEDSNLTLVDVS